MLLFLFQRRWRRQLYSYFFLFFLPVFFRMSKDEEERMIIAQHLVSDGRDWNESLQATEKRERRDRGCGKTCNNCIMDSKGAAKRRESPDKDQDRKRMSRCNINCLKSLMIIITSNSFACLIIVSRVWQKSRGRILEREGLRWEMKESTLCCTCDWRSIINISLPFVV